LERSPRSPRSGDRTIGTSVVRPDKGRMRFSEGTAVRYLIGLLSTTSQRKASPPRSSTAISSV
jgi:hypothetical protein